MKKLLPLSILAFAFAFSVNVVAQGFTFNTNLKQGMRNADVSELQKVLAAEGFFTAAPTGFFGSVTKKAVVAFQLANDLPGTGFVGPMTREVLNSMNTSTGNTGNTGNTGTACPTGWVCTPPAGNNNGGALVGSEGFAEVRVSPAVTNNPNVTSNTDVPVYALEFTAKQSDISVERINAEVAVTLSGSAENPSTLINRVTVKDGSTVLQSIPVNSSTFSKDTSVTPNKFYIQIAGLGVKVAKETKKTLTLTFDTNSIDSARSVVVGVYGGSNNTGIRSVDGRGISSTAGTSETRTHTFKKPGTSEATVSDDATPVYSTNYRVNTTGNGAEKALTSTFAVKSTTGTSKLTSVTVFVNKGVLSALGAIGSGGTTPSNLYLYQGSTLVDARSVNGAASSTASSSVTFDLTNYNVTVAADQTQTFTIKADMPSDTTANTVVSTFVQSVTYEKPNGATQTLGALNVPGTAVWHFFAPVVAQFNKVSSTASVVSYGTTVSGLTTTFVVDVTAVGGSLDATAATATVKLLNVGTATSTTLTSSVTFEGGITTIADGATKRGTISVTFPDAQVGSGTFKGQITGMRWKPSSGTAQVQLAGFEALDTNVIAR